MTDPSATPLSPDPDEPRRILKADYIKAVVSPEHAPEPLPAAVFAGRSNVGKSSLINALCERKALARTSNTPGRTRQIHYFNIDDTAHFVDLPGYGYAKVSKSEKRTWGPMMERFFRQAQGVRVVVLILDIRRDPTPEDFQMLEWLETAGHPYLVAVTKIDKLSNNERNNRMRELQKAFGLPNREGLAPVSAKTREGLVELRETILRLLE